MSLRLRSTAWSASLDSIGISSCKDSLMKRRDQPRRVHRWTQIDHPWPKFPLLILLPPDALPQIRRRARLATDWEMGDTNAARLPSSLPETDNADPGTTMPGGEIKEDIAQRPARVGGESRGIVEGDGGLEKVSGGIEGGEDELGRRRDERERV